MEKIKLERAQWYFDPGRLLGPPGGFGEVFYGTDVNGDAVAVKRLHIHAHDAAHRELRIARELVGRTFNNVISFLDAGQDSESDRYYLVMPKADKSLAQHLSAEGILDEETALALLLEMTNGLLEVPDLVHRDLKPGNVLRHHGKWKIADFGIAKFVEETTSKQTLRDRLTAPYAAPEQWKGEHVSSATDVYALGCIAYELLTGSPPFKGPEPPDYQRQHILEPPPALSCVRSRLASFIGMMLRKEPVVRPSARRIFEMLTAIDASQPEKVGGAALAKIGQSIGDEIARKEAAAAAEAADQERRLHVAKAANADFHQTAQELCERAVANALHAQYRCGAKDGANDVHQLALGQGLLLITPQAWGEVIQKGRLTRSGWDVIAGAEISVEMPGRYMRSASLWFTNAGNGNEYRWYEVTFKIGPHNPLIVTLASSMRRQSVAPVRRHQFQNVQRQKLVQAYVTNAPFAFAPNVNSDAALVRTATNGIVLAAQPEPIDFNSRDSFIDRWHSLFAEAAAGKLCKPNFAQ